MLVTKLPFVNHPSPYTDDEVRTYLKRIHFPSSELPQPTYATLSKIIQCHSLAIPFGALNLIYYKTLTTPLKVPIDPLNPYTTRGMRLDPQSIFNKLVIHEREGYCLEHNSLLRNILAHLGFQCYHVCGNMVDFDATKSEGRVVIEGLGHWIVIVILDNVEYLADVGFGAPGPTIPLALDPAQDRNGPNAPYHIIQTNYQQPELNHYYFVEWGFRTHPDGSISKWQPLYCFQPTPLTDADREVIHLFTSHYPLELFQQHLHLVKYIPDGSITLRDQTLTTRKKGLPPVTQFIETEQDRREIYRTVFQIELDPQLEEHLPLAFGQGQDSLEQ